MLTRPEPTGGIGLQSLVDRLASTLQKMVAQGMSYWQCQAASVVTILTEIVFGASSAWYPDIWLDVGCQGLADTANLLPLIERLQEDFTQDDLWGITSHNSAHSDALKLSPQVNCWYSEPRH